MHLTSGAGSGEPSGERAWDDFSSASPSVSDSDSDVEMSSNSAHLDVVVGDAWASEGTGGAAISSSAKRDMDATMKRASCDRKRSQRVGTQTRRPSYEGVSDVSHVGS